MLNRSLTSLADVVDWGLCVGCGACAYANKHGGVRMVHVEAEGYRPAFDDPSCGTSREDLDICPGYGVNGDLNLGGLPKTDVGDHEFGQTLEIWEGWAADPDVRFRGSSGGLLSALSLYCLDVAGFAGVVHAGMDGARPWMNRNYVSRTREDVLARAGSRYAPSAPCAALSEITPDAGPHVFIGRPCDAAAVSELRHRDPDTARAVGLVLTFFCAGTPSTRGTLDLVRKMGTDPSEIDELHYRGEGWPGLFRVFSRGRSQKRTLSYQESWGALTAYRPLRCNLCADGLGRLADISCGDAWEQHRDDGDPGRSLVLVRTERGRAILEGARRAGYITLERVGSANVLKAQANLLERRRQLFGRLLAFRLLGVPAPNYQGFSLLRSWSSLGPAAQGKTLFGTMRRIVMKRWFRRRPPIGRTPSEAVRS